MALLNDSEDGDLTNTQWFLIICGTCYAITVSMLLLTAWCHARRANHHQDRRNKRLTLKNNRITQMEDRVDRSLDDSFGNSSNSGNRVTQDQLVEDGILTEMEIKRSFVAQVNI